MFMTVCFGIPSASLLSPPLVASPLLDRWIIQKVNTHEVFFNEKDNIFIVLIHVYVCGFSINLFSLKLSLRIFIKKGISFQFCYYIEKFYKKFLMKSLRYYIMIYDATYLTITMPFNNYKNERQIQIGIKTLMILYPPWNIRFLRLCLVRSYV